MKCTMYIQTNTNVACVMLTAFMCIEDIFELFVLGAEVLMEHYVPHAELQPSLTSYNFAHVLTRIFIKIA